MLFARAHLSQILWLDGWTILQNEPSLGRKFQHGFQRSVRNDTQIRNQQTSQHWQAILSSLQHGLTTMDRIPNCSIDRRGHHICLKNFRQDFVSRNQRVFGPQNTQGALAGSLHARESIWHVPQRQPKEHSLCHQLLDQYWPRCLDRRFERMVEKCTTTIFKAHC